MIHVDETDPLGDVPPAFPYREVEIQRGVDPKQLYELSSELGRGKFGVVYKSKEKSTGVRLAAKFIQIQKKGDRRNIEREVHMMNVLQHSKIAQLYAAFEFDRTFCVMMELVEGGELFDRVLDDKFVLTERACSIFMRQICDAVAYIHGNNIIHLDMKPENILCLTEAGNRIKIIDFGLAREYDPDNKLQVLFGTPEFVAPEVVNFEAISFATDMWSVGVIAYVLVSGLSPFAGEDDIQTMGNITIGRYDFLDEAFDEVSEEAIDFINRCLVKDQKDRLTAEDALKHKWIKRKPQYYPTNRRPSIPNFKQILLETNNNNTNVTNNEIDKENLKELVGKWNETPNNRYAFEQDTENIIAPSGESVQLRRPTLPEVSGLANGTSNTSGSRRGSIARDGADGELGTGASNAPCEGSVGATSEPETGPDSHSSAHPHPHRDQDSEGAAPAASAASEAGDAEASSSASVASSASTVELDSELECLKSKVHTMIRTSRAQNKLNELAQRPDFLANDPFKLPTFRFLPKSISLCNDDSVFKENYTKFCDRNSASSGGGAPPKEEKPAAKPGVDGVVRKKSTATAGGATLRKKKEPQETTSTVTTTTFSSTGSGKIASTTVRKTIVKQQKVADVEDDVSSPRKSFAQAKSLESTASTTTTTTTTTTKTTSNHATLTPTASIKRTKFRVNQMSSRDVPVAPLNGTVARRYLERSGVLGTSKDQPEAVAAAVASADDTVTANNLRNSALKLRSLSVDWDAVDVAVENRSMKTINSILKRHAVASSAVRQIQAQLEATITTHK